MTNALHRPRRGSCLPILLLGLALMGLIILIISLASLFTSNAGTAVSDFDREVNELLTNAKSFEAPGRIEVPLEQGGALVLISPDGTVGDKRIGRPPASVAYTVKVTNAAGNAVEVEASNMPRNPSAAFELLGWFKVNAAETYAIEVQTADGSATPAAIMVCAGDQSQIDVVVNGLTAIGKVAFGICGSVCGIVFMLAFGIPAIIIRLRKSRQAPDPALEL
jgi:hypothetical protein